MAKKGLGPSRESYVGLPSRKAAVQLLSAVLQDRRPLDDAIGRYGTRGAIQHLAHRDRAFARAIAATALRRLGQIEDVLNQFLEKPLPKKCGGLREILIAGATQLLFLDTPPHAVINLAVSQCQYDRQARRFSKLVNAVLRRISEKGTAIITDQDEERINTPAWLWDRWVKSYGEEAARHIGRAHLQEAPLDLTVKSDPQSWADKLAGIALPTGSVRLLHKGLIDRIEGYDDGAWWVQDAAAALPARLLGDVRGKRVADLCAAPGGKTAQLVHAGACVTAVDISLTRLDRLKENLARLKLEAEIIEANILDWRPNEPFDAILLDAPCMATGTIRRHPDILHLKQESEIAELTALQKQMLDHALTMIKPGGRLVYCTCSLEPEEGLALITDYLQNHSNIHLDPLNPQDVAEQSDWITEGCLRTLPISFELESPDYSGIDGFFAARMIRV